MAHEAEAAQLRRELAAEKQRGERRNGTRTGDDAPPTSPCRALARHLRPLPFAADSRPALRAESRGLARVAAGGGALAGVLSRGEHGAAAERRGSSRAVAGRGRADVDGDAADAAREPPTQLPALAGDAAADGARGVPQERHLVRPGLATCGADGGAPSGGSCGLAEQRAAVAPGHSAAHTNRPSDTRCRLHALQVVSTVVSNETSSAPLSVGGGEGVVGCGDAANGAAAAAAAVASEVVKAAEAAEG